MGYWVPSHRKNYSSINFQIQIFFQELSWLFVSYILYQIDFEFRCLLRLAENVIFGMWRFNNISKQLSLFHIPVDIVAIYYTLKQWLTKVVKNQINTLWVFLCSKWIFYGDIYTPFFITLNAKNRIMKKWDNY